LITIITDNEMNPLTSPFLSTFGFLATLGVATAMNATAMRTVLDFRDPAQVPGWTAVDDRVMGGVSASQVATTPKGLVFSGVVSLNHNGGFASIRAEPQDYRLAGATALILRIQGDGQTYKFGLRTDDAFDGVQYQTRFVTEAGQWINVVLPVSDFQPTFRGRLVDAPVLDPARIRVLGFLIADRQAGPFRLVIQSIQAQWSRERVRRSR
jgi:hypothetical protein